MTATVTKPDALLTSPPGLGLSGARWPLSARVSSKFPRLLRSHEPVGRPRPARRSPLQHMRARAGTSCSSTLISLAPSATPSRAALSISAEIGARARNEGHSQRRCQSLRIGLVADDGRPKTSRLARLYRTIA